VEVNISEKNNHPWRVPWTSGHLSVAVIPTTFSRSNIMIQATTTQDATTVQPSPTASQMRFPAPVATSSNPPKPALKSESGWLEELLSFIMLCVLVCTMLAFTTGMALNVVDEITRYSSLELLRGIAGM
jgi:hypothetical protein